jgi:hypothetical protein
MIRKAFYNCTNAEAEKLYDAYVAVVVGRPSELVEISILAVEVARASENPFEIPPQYVARRAAEIGSLTRMSSHTYYLGWRNVLVEENDQVWMMVALEDHGLETDPLIADTRP